MADRIKGITVVLGGDTKGLSKALSGVNKDINSTQKQLKDVEKLLKLDPTNTELLAQKQRLLGDAVALTKGKLDSLKEAEKQVQQQFERGEVSQAQYDALQREIVSTENQLKSLQTQAKTTNTVVGKIGDAAKAVADGTNDLADSIDNLNGKAKVASAAVVGGGTLAVKTVSDVDSAVGSFLAQTGAAESQTEDWKQALENIYKENYGENFEDIANSMATVQKTLDDVDPSNIELLTEDAIALRDTFGYEVNESTRAAKALMDNFGVSAHQAFNLIATGAQNGLDYSGELLDTISEYSVQFGKVGFSADDFFNIMQSGSQNSAFNLDKVGDAIKELSIRVIDGSDTTQQGFDLIGLNADEMAKKFAQGGDTARKAFDQTIAALAAMEDPVQQNIAGVDLFGTMWEDLGSTATLALGDISDSAYAAKDNLEEIKEEKYENLINDLQEVGRTIRLDILTPLGEQLMPIIDEIVGNISELVAAFAGMSDEQQKVVVAVGAVIAALPALLTFVGGFLNVIGTVSSGIALFTGAITTAPAAATGFAAVLKVIATVFGGIATVIGAVVSGIISFVGLIGSGIAAAAGVISSVVTTLFTFITGTVIPGIITALQGLFAFIVANPIVITIAAIIAAVVGLAVIINQNAAAITAALQAVNDFLQNVFAINWTMIFGPILGETINAFIANLQNLWNSIYTILGGIITFVTGVFAGNWTQAWNGIKQIFKGVFYSLIAIAKAPLNAIIGMINGVIGGINAMIDGLNSISIDVPDEIPGVGGMHLGFDIPNLGTLPYLAKGGTVLSGSAIVGEAGPELLTVGPGGTVVQPLTTSQKSVAPGRAITIERMNFYGYTPQDGRSLAKTIDIELGKLM
ncbi:phage tail tape measure protein [Subdoligranulum variabile]|uniref:Phage tail tape measure protein, TP901 family n=1 Tax=Subdoligranulum variabile DSM 15176 TaxID=411471 RepID=D1PND9_9FIRM|nr:phage tail tape measure protein [Subdoligranulum variabile]EFB76074.1 phage tail tape measure protein, TP901 family [Subdoligranulum variabile DSM 15176]UWP68723.1 phage tail tape measure protein [Subdoligranulum variabile]